MEQFPYWRNIYNTLIDEFKAVSSKGVSEVLSEIDVQLVEGILLYKKYDNESYTSWKKRVQISSSEGIDKLMKDTSYAIDLDCSLTYKMFCNYIMFEYYGNITDIEEVACAELHRKLFINKIWNFISAERMFQLKTMQFLLHHHEEKNHKLETVISKFIEKHGLKKIREKLIQQLENCMNEICPHKDHGLSNHNCIERDEFELVQIIISLIYAIEYQTLDIDEFLKILKFFTKHGYPTSASYTGSLSESHQLSYCLYFIAMKSFWIGNELAKNFEKLEKIFNEMCSIANCHPILLISWGMMVLSLPSEKLSSVYLIKLPHLVMESLNNESFKFLFCLLNNGYHKDAKLNIIIHKAVYYLYKRICQKIGNQIKIYECEESTAILAKLMEVPEICEEIMTDSTNPVRKFFDITINLFPYDAKSFCLLLGALIKHKEYQANVMTHLQAINIYSEELAESSSVNVPPQSRMTTVELSNKKTIIQYYGDDISYSFLSTLEVALQNVMDYVTSDEVHNASKEISLTNVTYSMDLLCEIVDKYEDIWKDNYFIQILQSCKLVLARITMENSRCYNLVDKIIRLLIRGMRLNSSRILSNVLLSSNCLPTATAQMLPINQLAKINLLNDCQLLQLIIRERSKGNYELIYTYIELIKDSLENRYENERILLPGMLFIIQHIFPLHLGWKGPTVHEKAKISYDILLMLFKILHSHAMGKDKEHSMQQLYDICIITLLNNDAFVKTFLTILRYRNEYLEQLMVKEVDWEIGGRRIILCVRQALTITLWLFNNIKYEDLKKTIFWQYFSYSGVNFPSVLRIICEYINHKFDSVLPKLACRLFRRISMDSSIPVLACMEIDNYQVQSMFLERLRDPLEDDEMRIALLELITTCVIHQNGMTAAFFNMHFKKNKDAILPEKDETIISFLGEYLDGIAQSPETLRCSVQSAILTLVHTLWKEKRLNLIQSLITRSTFWTSLINPLNKNYEFRSETYFQILDILTMESYYKPTKEITVHLQDLFSNKLDLLKKIYKLILHAMRKYETDVEGALKMQLAWKRFIILMVRNHQDIIDNDVKIFVARSTLEGLLDHLSSPGNTSVIGNWLELLMYLWVHCKLTQFDNETNMELLIACFKHIDEIYQRLSKKCREAVITIIIKSLELFKSFICEPSQEGDKFLVIVRNIIEKEFEDVVRRRATKLNCSDHVAWHLIIVIGNSLLPYEHHHKWLLLTQFVHKVANSISYYANSCQTMPIAKMSAMFLLNAAKSPLVADFTSLDFDIIYESVRTPSELKNYAGILNNGKNPDMFLDYWMTYYYLVSLKIQLLDKLGFLMFRKCMDFIQMQRDNLIGFLRLIQVTVNPIALKLIATCVCLFNKILRWEGMINVSTITAYYDILPEILNSCINILLRPKIMKFYVPYECVNLEQLDSVPLSYVANIMNHILDVITLSLRGLHLVSPALLKLINREVSMQTSYQLQLNWDFHIPNVYNPHENNKSLTFGALMCVVHYLCKARQLQASSKAPPKSDAMLLVSSMLHETEPEERPEEEVQAYVSYLSPEYIEPASIEPFNSIHRFATSEIYSLTSPWLSLMDQERTTIALEVINALLASQIYMTITMPIDNWDVKQQMHMLKRELCSELHFFHDFVRKQNLHSQKYAIDGNRIVCIKKPTDKSYTSYDYLMMLSHWFMEICDLTP